MQVAIRRTRAHEFFDHTPLRRSPPPSCAAWTCRTRPLSALRPCAPAGLSHRAGGAAIAASGGVAGGAGGHALEVAAPKGRLNFLSVRVIGPDEASTRILAYLWVGTEEFVLKVF